MNQRVLITALAAVVASAAFFMMALKPKRQEAADLNADIAKVRTELTAAQQLLAANTQAKANYREAYAAVVRLGKAVPADDDVRSLMVQLDAAAKDTKVDFRSIQVGQNGGSAPAPGATGAAATTQLPPGVTVGPAGFPVEPFQFTFRGSFFRLSEFFSKLEGFVNSSNKRLDVTGRLLTLDGLELQPDATGFPNISASVNATSYLVSPLEGLTGGATPQGPATTGGAATGAAPATPGQAAPTTGSSPATTTATSTGALR